MAKQNYDCPVCGAKLERSSLTIGGYAVLLCTGFYDCNIRVSEKYLMGRTKKPFVEEQQENADHIRRLENMVAHIYNPVSFLDEECVVQAEGLLAAIDARGAEILKEKETA